jgi:mycothione reductase
LARWESGNRWHHGAVRHFDLCIIGTGSGNSIVDDRFDGQSVAIIEPGAFGGTCLNVGCIPSKMYVYPAGLARTPKEAARLGVDLELVGVRWPDIRDRIFGRIDADAASGRRYREQSRNVTVLSRRCRFVGPRRLLVGTEEITADRIVVAAGSRPVVPEIPGLHSVPFHTSDTIMRIDALPERLVVLGSGYIAAEFAHVFSAFGTAVSIVGRSTPMLRGQDETVAERFTALARDRWDVHLGAEPVRVRGDGDEIVLDLADGTVVRGDLLLVATGRRPNGDRLDLPAAGIPTHPDGRIVVDEHQRTPVDGVFAMGDVSSPFQLKHVANHESRVVAHNLLHPDALKRTDHRFVPAAVFTEPQIAAVGRTEQECRADGLDYAMHVQAYGDVAYGWAMEDDSGFCKVLAERGTGRLLGAHILGPDASVVIQPLIQAMSFGLTAREMACDQYWIHPALPELVENALLGLRL